MTNNNTKTWDFFIAYAAADKEMAEALYGELAPLAQVFLDSVCIVPGDNWDQALATAQHDSAVTVALVSAQASDAYYQGEEIANAIRMERNPTDRHRIVPILLPGSSSAGDELPYGLVRKQAIAMDVPDDLPEVARRLVAVLAESIPRGVPAPLVEDTPVQAAGVIGLGAAIAAMVIAVANVEWLGNDLSAALVLLCLPIASAGIAYANNNLQRLVAANRLRYRAWLPYPWSPNMVRATGGLHRTPASFLLTVVALAFGFHFFGVYGLIPGFIVGSGLGLAARLRAGPMLLGTAGMLFGGLITHVGVVPPGKTTGVIGVIAGAIVGIVMGAILGAVAGAMSGLLDNGIVDRDVGTEDELPGADIAVDA